MGGQPDGAWTWAGLTNLERLLGPSYSVADLALVSGRPAVDVAAALAPALRAGTLRDATDPLVKTLKYMVLNDGGTDGLYRIAVTGRRMIQP